MNGQWQRLNPRLAAVGLSWFLAPAATAGLGILIAGEASLAAIITIGSSLCTALVVAIALVLRYVTTRFRLTAQMLEIRSGKLFRRHRWIPLERIRTVDVTANPAYRIFGLATLVVSTGEQVSESDTTGRLKLDGITRAHAETLRARLLSVTAAEATPEVTRLDWAWLRYAPLTLWGIGGVGIVLGSAYRVIDGFGVKAWELPLFRGIYHWFAAMPLAVAIGVLVAIVVAVGALGATAMFVESWWDFRLEREDLGTFRVRRGLITMRSTTVRRDRLRGAQVAEPLLMRWAGGARANAIATGLGSYEDSSMSARSALLPPAPRRHAYSVVATVLGLAKAPMADVRWAPHPRSGVLRRLGWTAWFVLPPVAALAVLGLWLVPDLLTLAWVLAILALPAGIAFAVDAHRSLGHALSGDYLLARSGTFARRSVAVQRAGIIGWTITQSPFQRRHGLLTVGATTAAGQNVYRIRDVDEDDGLAVAEEAVPGLLAPFLAERETLLAAFTRK